MDMLFGLYFNFLHYPSMYVFSLPINNGSTPAKEVLSNDAGAASWHEAWDIAFSPSSEHVPAQINGQDNNHTPMLQ